MIGRIINYSYIFGCFVMDYSAAKLDFTMFSYK